MTKTIETPQELNDETLAEISGGPSTYKTPGVFIQEITTLPTAGANPMDLKRGIDTRD